MGQVTSGTGYIAGGIAYPIAIVIDTNQTAWVIDYLNQHLTLLSSSGQPLSGATGYTSTQLQFPISLAMDANHNAWVGNTYGGTVTKVSASGQFTSYACCNWAGGIAIDQRGYAWVANYMGNSVSQVGSDGSVVSSGYTDSQGSLQHPQGIAIDGAGHVWVTNIMGSSITELAGSAASSPRTDSVRRLGLGRGCGSLGGLGGRRRRKRQPMDNGLWQRHIDRDCGIGGAGEDPSKSVRHSRLRSRWHPAARPNTHFAQFEFFVFRGTTTLEPQLLCPCRCVALGYKDSDSPAPAGSGCMYGFRIRDRKNLH